ncbi:MAG TPA: hypothetical protein VNS09_06580 [Solirubrobacter sp.]|nr:hypothetical protein [Solirubrobacter sp.]
MIEAGQASVKGHADDRRGRRAAALGEDGEPFDLVGTRAFLAGTRRFSGAARVVVLVATWAVACAALARPSRDVSGRL